MPRRQLEERVTRGGMTVRLDGRVVGEPGGLPVPLPGPQYAGETRGPRQVPVLPPLSGEDRARMDRPPPSGEPHRALTTTHAHWHASHGDESGTPVYGHPPGQHLHSHSHQGDASHDHEHAAPSPGNPGMPSAGLASAGQSGETRGNMDAGLEDIDLLAAGWAFLRRQGVNLPLALQEAETAGLVREQRARERARAAGDVAIHLRKAKRALAFEQQGFLERRAGFSIAKISEATERVTLLEAQLREACLDDPAVIGEAKRRAAL